MDTDELARRLREQRTGWDDVRERRVLNQVFEETRRPRRATAYWIAGGGVVAAAACALLILALGTGGDRTDEPGEDLTDRGAAILDLSGNGRAVLGTESLVSIARRTPNALELDQTRGTVRYEIERVAGQRISIEAAGVVVSVVGTVFEIAILEGGLVRVSVERGFVEVDDGRRKVELGRGEAIAVSASMELEPIADADAGEGEPRGEEVAAVSEVGDAGRDRAPPRSAKASDGTGKAASEGGAADGAFALLAEIDAARGSGRLADAARLLERFVREYPKDSRVVSSLFTLGKVERSLAHHEKAALSFHRCWRRAPTGALAEDARAEEAMSWSNAGRADRASRAAGEYLRLYPGGTHEARMQRLVD
jgi:TolA-binding protein